MDETAEIITMACRRQLAAIKANLEWAGRNLPGETMEEYDARVNSLLSNNPECPLRYMTQEGGAFCLKASECSLSEAK
jgi:hypothetical protein